MPEHNLHAREFDAATQTKLELYGNYVAEWLPVFLNARQPVSRIQIFDFFAGPGRDIGGRPGSPVIALQKIEAALKGTRPAMVPPIHLYLNELDARKFANLRQLQIPDSLKGLLELHFVNQDFDEVFPAWVQTMKRPGAANLAFVDQNGIKHMIQPRFETLCLLPQTDFLFFVSSSIVNRFRDDANIRKCLPLENADVERMSASNAHGIIADAYRRWIPQKVGASFFLGRFSLQKEHSSNSNGLVFGSKHILGILKFLALCWKQDQCRGAANYDNDKEGIDFSTGSLFREWEKPKKHRDFEHDLKNGILDAELQTNHEIIKFAVEHGFLPKHARAVVSAMLNDGDLPRQPRPHISQDAILKEPPTRILLHGGTKGT